MNNTTTTTTHTQPHELAAWLGDDHGLSQVDLAALAVVADQITAHYPDSDDTAERDVALIGALYMVRAL